MSNREGQQVGNYRLLHLIGQGSFAEVYLGEHLHLNTQAAIKVLHTQFTSEEKEQFYAEARTLARLIHPHIIRIHDFAVEDGIPFLVMDYAPNGSLRQSHPRGTRVPLATIVSYVQQVAEALDYIHEQKLIHRDVKPENMLLGHNNEVLLTEFDIAIIAQSSRSQQTQEAAGAIAYIAPEQLRGKPRTASDQYSLAVAVYEWLSGDPPFSGSPREIVSQHLSAPPPPLYPKVPTISPAIEHVVLQALAKEPKERFASVQAFARALEEASNPESPGPTLLSPSSGDVSRSEQKRPALRDLPTGTVTLLFADIEASTRLLQQLGEHYTDLLDDFRELLRTIFDQCHGYEVDMQGDAFFVAFARATDAVSAAIAMQRALADHSWPEGVSVRIRIGLHTGEPLLTAEGYVGLDVHQAARIMNAGHGGQILLSQTTSHLVEQDLSDDVKLDDLGEHRFKDLGRPKRIFQLLLSDIPANFPPLKTLDAYANNLPVQHTPFIGREKEVEAVCDLLCRDDVRLLTLTGPGGTGKTRLALQAAAELCETFTGGVYFVNLAPISDPAFVVPTTAETLGIQEGADQTFLERLKENLRQKHVLLLLDNFEQVVSAAVQVVDLLAACLQLKVLVTSREVLHVRAEREFPVPALPLPNLQHLPDLAALSHYTAVALFLQRAQAVKPDFQLTHANARAIAEICARLDGLPLAIELAAARIKLLPPQALLARIDQRLVMLTSASRDVPSRQQTLRNTIAWSYNMLDVQEQRLFRCLCVFVGGATLEAIEVISVATGEERGYILDGLASLIDKSLLRQDEQEGEEPRFVLLETIREYGREVLAACGEMEATSQAHAMHYLTLAEGAELEWAGPQEGVWLAWWEREHDNLRAAMSWLLERGETEIALRLGAALWWLWEESGSYLEGWNFLERALEGSEEVASTLRAKALWSAGNLASWLGRFEQGEALCQESLALFRAIGDTRGMGTALFHLAIVARLRGDFAAARSLSEESIALNRKVGHTKLVAMVLEGMAEMDILQGEYARARPLMEESLILSRSSGNMSGIGYSLIWLATALFSQGDLVRARTAAEECLALSREIGSKPLEANVLVCLGEIAFYQGDMATARLQFEQSRAYYQEVGDEAQLAWTLSFVAKIIAAQGDLSAARTLYEESLMRGQRVNRNLSFLDIPPALEGLAAVIAAQGESVWAARLWGMAEAQRKAYGTPLAPIYRADYEQSVANARAQLNEQSFATAWAEGRSMTPEQVLGAEEQPRYSRQPFRNRHRLLRRNLHLSIPTD